MAIRSFGRLFSSFLQEQQLYTKRLTFEASKDQGEVTVEAVYQDSLPTGSSKGTVVALHGAPGSHLDFKYIKPLLEQKGIRFIGVNFPGFGYTPEHSNHMPFYHNYARNQYVNALLDELNIHNNVFMMGHSRGTENALMVAVKRKTAGLVLLNPIGLRVHRGVSPLWRLKFLSKMCDIPYSSPIMQPLMFQAYKFIKLKVSSGQMAINCLKTMETIALDGQIPYAEELIHSDTKTLLLYSGKDWLMETEIPMEFSQFLHLPELNCAGDDEHTARRSEKEALKKLEEKNNKGISVCFEKEGHFLQKMKAQFIVDCIDCLLTQQEEKKIKSRL